MRRAIRCPTLTVNRHPLLATNELCARCGDEKEKLRARHCTPPDRSPHCTFRLLVGTMIAFAVPAAAAPLTTPTSAPGRIEPPSEMRGALFGPATQAREGRTEVGDSGPQVAAGFYVGTFLRQYPSNSVFRVSAVSLLGGSQLLTFSVGSEKVATFREGQVFATAYYRSLTDRFLLPTGYTVIGSANISYRSGTGVRASMGQWGGLGLLLVMVLVFACLYYATRHPLRRLTR